MIKKLLALLFALLLAAPASAQLGIAVGPAVTAVGSAAVGQIPAVTDGSNAPAGDVGEVLTCTTPGTTSSVTVTSATPGIVSWTAHGISIGGAVNFTAAVIPTGLVAGTTYYVSSQNYTANSFAVSTTVANAIAGTSITTSSTGTTVVGQAWALPGTAASKNICGLSATAGDWYVQTSITFFPANTTNVTVLRASSSTTTDTADATPGRANTIYYGPSGIAFNGGVAVSLDTTESRFNSNSTQTFFGVAFETFTVAGLPTWGTIRATRRSR
jgi:hypothetical protein